MEILIRRLEQGAMALACLCVVALMLVISTDALGRYLLDSPLPWGFELVTYYLLVCVAYFALSATYTHGDHINITLLHARLPVKARAVIDAVCGLLAAAVFTAIAWGTFNHVLVAYANKEFIPGYIVWPVWLSYLPIPLGTALLVLRLLHHSAVLLARGEDPAVKAHQEPELAE